MSTISRKIGGVAALVLASSVMACANPHHSGYHVGGETAPVVEEVVVVEQPQYEEEVVTVDCRERSHHVYKECTGHH